MTREGHRAAGTDLSPLYIFGGAGACAVALAAGLSLGPGRAWAVPSFARQTGQPCATCHNGYFPQLTAYGRQFKLNGYTAGGTRCRDSVAADPTPQIPISVMLEATYTHIQKDLFDLPTNKKGELNGLATNNNVMVQDTSVFYGGQIYCQLGAFIQATYDRNDEAFFLDNTDIRYANRANVHGIDLIYGIDANNNPTVEDPWNTTPAWRLPGDPGNVFDPGFPAPLIDGGLAGLAAGAGAYVFVNNMFYAAVLDYKTLDRNLLQALGQETPPSVGPTIGLEGGAPYWRLAIEKTWDVYSLMFGTFGMTANVIQDVTIPMPADKFTDVGWDAQFQYLSDVHFITARISYIYEWEKLDGSFSLGNAANLKNQLAEFNASVTYAYDARYSVTLGYFTTTGSTDLDPTTGTSFFGTLNGSPNTSGEIIDIGYSPWSRGGPAFWPWLNTRFGVKALHYEKLQGASTAYAQNSDGITFRNARDDDSLLLYSWTAF
jgi:hypothetical protein